MVHAEEGEPLLESMPIILDIYCKSIPTCKQDVINIKNSKMQKLLLDLSKYSYEIIHLQGKNNLICDALSRSPIPNTEYDNEITNETE